MITEKDIKGITFEKSHKNLYIMLALLIIIAFSFFLYIYYFYAPESQLRDARNRAALWAEEQASMSSVLKKASEDKVSLLEKNYYKISDYCKNDEDIITLFAATIEGHEKFNSTCGTDCMILKEGNAVVIERDISGFAWKSSYVLPNMSIEECIIEHAEETAYEIMNEKTMSYGSREIITGWAQKAMVFSGPDKCSDFATMTNVFNTAMIGLMETEQGRREMALRLKSINVTVNKTELMGLYPYSILSSIDNVVKDAYRLEMEKFYDDIIKNYNKALNSSMAESFDVSILLTASQMKMFENCKFLLASQDINEALVDNNYRAFLSLYAQGKYMDSLKYALIVGGYEIAKGAL
ncbi:MAG: hypothetical protein HZB66_03590 [Candidatus Aenigmarchaeota archaeon]|nr:hypothetical protein [Candidatus Aenigmarchaeota archaeon]